MNPFRAIGNWFRGAFGGNDDDEKRRREEEARRRAQQQRQNQPKPQQPNNFLGVNNPNALNKPVEKPKPQTVEPPKPKTPTQTAPRVNPQLSLKLADYERPGVQDVNNYYANDLKVLKEEVAKGEQADQRRIQGIMQSLDNRRKELQEFHKQRGESKSFKSARALEEKVKATRGDWTKERQNLQNFWDSVGKEEKDDFLAYLAERNPQANFLGIDNPNQQKRNWRRTEDFTPAEAKVEVARQRQENEAVADDMLQNYRDVQLSEFGNSTIGDLFYNFNRQDATKRRADIVSLARAIQTLPDGDKKNQAIALYILLDTRGNKKTSTGDKISSFSDTAADKIGGGVGRGILRGIDYVVPGYRTLGTGALADVADEWDERAQESREWLPDQEAANVGATVGSVVKGIGDIGLMLVPVSRADQLARGVQVARGSGRVARGANLAARTIPGSAAGTAIDTVQTAGRGDETDLLKSGSIGLGADLLLGAVQGRVRPLQRLRQLFGGRPTEETAEAAVGAGLTGAGRREVVGEALDTVEGLSDDIVDEATRTRMAELRQLVDDIDMPAFQRSNARAELRKLEEEAMQRAAQAGVEGLDYPTFLFRRDIQNIIDTEERTLTKYIADNPQLTRQQIEQAREEATARANRLIEELRASRAANAEVIEGQAAATNQAAETRANTNAEVQAQAAARTSPAPGEVVQGAPASTSPEVEANNPYVGRTDEEVLYQDAPSFTERGNLSLPQRLSPDRFISTRITRPVVEAIDRGISAAQTSSNPISRGFGRFFTGVSREAGRSPELLAQARSMRGGAEYGRLMQQRIDQIGAELTPESRTKVWATLDPQRAKEIGIKPVDLSELTPEELVYQEKLKEVTDFYTSGNLQRGFITREQAANGEYLKRGYSVFEDASQMKQSYSQARTGLLNQFKGRDKVSEELLEKTITDPGYLVGKKAAESHAAWAMSDYGSYLVDSGIAVQGGRAGYRQLPNSKLFGKAAGQWVPANIAEDFTGFEYNIGMLNAFNDVLNAYDSLKIRRAKKQLLTVFNPAVRLGNRISNQLVFANMNGINPVQFNKVYYQVDKMQKEGHQLYREAVEQGLTGTDITQADFVRRISDYVEDKNIAQRAIEWSQKSYSGADDKARIAAYTIHRSRGYSPAEAAAMTQRGFQDYKSVGFFYDMAAKTPVIGNAFVRFAGDAIRIAKNAAVDHPLRTAATLALWTQFTEMMSNLSDESEEDRATREGRFGAPKIPFTDISLTVQTPWGEINAARFLPFYALNDVENEAGRFLPIQGNPLTSSGWDDPLLGQVLQVMTDRDFRGRSIRDPNDVEFADGTSKYEFDQLSDEERRNNLLRFLFTNNAPIGREIDSLAASRNTELFGFIGDKDGADIYDKERSGWQALFRALGVKVEDFGAEKAEDTRQTQEYFDRVEETEAELANLSPGAQSAYRRLTGLYNLREQVPNPFEPGTTRDKNAAVYDWSEQKWGEYMQYPELFDLMERRANREAQAGGAPLNPIFDSRLPRQFRYQLAQQRSIAPGDDLELQQRMYEDPLWDTYQVMLDEYKRKAQEYFPESDNEDFHDDKVRHQNAKFPEKPPLWAAYLEARNRGEKPEWNDRLAAARTEWENAKLNWTNRERAARGLPPIPAEQWFNETFGYDPNANGRGFGFGGGSGYRWQDHINTLGRLTNYTGDVSRLNAIEAEAMPELMAMLRALQAGEGGGRARPPFGARSVGR